MMTILRHEQLRASGQDPMEDRKKDQKTGEESSKAIFEASFKIFCR